MRQQGSPVTHLTGDGRSPCNSDDSEAGRPQATKYMGGTFYTQLPGEETLHIPHAARIRKAQAPSVTAMNVNTRGNWSTSP